MNKIVLSTVFLAVISGGTMSMAQDQKSQKPSTFFFDEEGAEPSISVKPLGREQQEIKEKEFLTTGIQQTALVSVPPTVAVILPIKKTEPVWTLAAGRTVGQELQAWGDKAGWKVIWSMPKDWSVPASTSFSGDFPTVAADVIKTLAANGALVRAQFFEGNNTMVVTGPGVAAQ